jgi:hypothetical protein
MGGKPEKCIIGCKRALFAEWNCPKITFLAGRDKILPVGILYNIRNVITGRKMSGPVDAFSA